MKYIVTIILIVLLFIGCMSNNANPEIWKEITEENWREVPYISGRVATEEDLDSGIAAFASAYNDTIPYEEITIPSLALFKGNKVIIIQAEYSPALGTAIIGIRFFKGGIMSCVLDDVELIE